MTTRWIALPLVLLTAVGCVDPLIGNWRAEDRNDCGEKDEIAVFDDLTGDGALWAFTQNGCIRCKFDFDATSRGDGRYDVDLDFDECHCDGDQSATADCRLKNGNDTLDCEIDWRSSTGAVCLNGSQDFERND
jgi:hypothetical protein